MSIQWFDFTPIIAGSFGREDMGMFCEVGSNLFVVPFFEMAITKISTPDLLAEIELQVARAKKQETFEFMNGEFTNQLSTDWPYKIKQSLVFAKHPF